jgi:hypothetical protein
MAGESNNNAASLPKEVADKYELKHIPVGRYELVGVGEVDFTSIDLKTAAKVARKTPYLVAKETPAPAKKSPAAA